MSLRALGLLAAAGCLDAPPGALTKDAGADAAAPVLLAAYRFEASDMLADSSGNGHHAECISTACPTSIADRNDAGQAVQFDGLNDLVTAPPVGAAAFTVMFWLRLDSPEDFELMCPVNRPYGPTGVNSWQLCLRSQTPGVGRLEFYTTEEPRQLAGNVPSEAGVWHHAAIRWDGAKKTIWYDGIDVATGEGTTRYDDSDLRLGSDLDGDVVQAAYAGSLDDLEVWDGALPEEAIKVAAED